MGLPVGGVRGGGGDTLAAVEYLLRGSARFSGAGSGSSALTSFGSNTNLVSMRSFLGVASMAVKGAVDSSGHRIILRMSSTSVVGVAAALPPFTYKTLRIKLYFVAVKVAALLRFGQATAI